MLRIQIGLLQDDIRVNPVLLSEVISMSALVCELGDFQKKKTIP